MKFTVTHAAYLREIERRRQSVLAMRRREPKPMTWREIGDALGVTRQRAWQIGMRK